MNKPSIIQKAEHDIFMNLATGTDPKAVFTWIKNNQRLSAPQKAELIEYTINEYDRMAEDDARIKWLD